MAVDGIARNAPSIRMGEMSVAETGYLRTLLGSCIGVALYDHRYKVAGLAHIVLPDSRGTIDTPGKYADTAIPLLIQQLEALVEKKLRLSAKIAGGSNMFATSATKSVGEQNITAIERLLDQRKIPIVARHLGGTQGRRMTIEVATGQVSIEVVGATSTEI